MSKKEKLSKRQEDSRDILELSGTNWNTHLSLNASSLTNTSDLQKFVPFIVEVHIPLLRTQRSDGGSLVGA